MESPLQEKPQDGDILLRVAQNDPEAMRTCIENYGGLVAGIVRRYLSSPCDIDDVVQEIFMEIWEKADRYDPGRAKEATFIGLLARRRSIDAVRKLSRQPDLKPLTEEMDLMMTTESSGMGVDRDRVQLAIKTLPARTRELFQMHFQLGMTHPEIAEKTNLPLGTVKTTLRRGLLELRKTIKNTAGKEALS